LRFNHVALLAVASVRQSCHTSGGGWGRLTPTVGRAVEKDLKVENYMRI